MTNSVIEKSCHRVLMGKTNRKGVVPPSVLCVEEVIDMKGEDRQTDCKKQRTQI